MNYEDMSPDLKQFLDETPVLTKSDLEELAEANRELNQDPKHIAGIIKSVFVNDIICAMQQQGLNKKQLAKKWGKSRQYLGKLLDKEKARNFTVDTMVSLSMSLGLRPQIIKLDQMEGVRMHVARTVNKSISDTLVTENWCNDDLCECVVNFAKHCETAVDLKKDGAAADSELELAA